MQKTVVIVSQSLDWEKCHSPSHVSKLAGVGFPKEMMSIGTSEVFLCQIVSH